MSTSGENISHMPVATDGINTLLSPVKFTLFGLSCTYKLSPARMSGSNRKKVIPSLKNSAENSTADINPH